MKLKKEPVSMNIIKALFKQKLFILGLLIPIIWQIVYFSIVIPAVNNSDGRVNNLKIAIVNEDAVSGVQIADQLSKTLPFETEPASDYEKSLESMNDGDYNMVVHIPSDFTVQLQQGNAQVAYVINQATPSMTKQLMETAAKTINQTLNANAFNTIKETIQQKSTASLSQAGLPAETVTAIGKAFSQAFGSLKQSPITGDIQKINNADGLIKTGFPLYIFLTYFIGSILLTLTHSWVYRSLAKQYARSKLYGISLGINLVYSLIIPWLVIGFIAGFGISFSQSIWATWLLLSAGMFTFLSVFQMFNAWLGMVGTGIMVLILFPLQLVASGFLYPREILPAFYNVTANILPATYFGSGIIKVFYGELSISGEIGILIVISAICITVSALALLKKSGNKAAADSFS
jgi:uncharacterized phage infection (PIP) family protein YhgE